MTGEKQNENVQVDRSNAKRNRRYWWFAILSVSGLVLSFLLILWCKPWLNESERRMLGVWTWQDTPGETMVFRSDGTLRFTTDSNNREVFSRWKIDNGMISNEYSERNTLEYVAKNILFRRKWERDTYPVKFNADGTVTIAISGGKERILIPGESVQYEFLKKAR